MKISYRTHPALQKLFEQRLGLLKMHAEDESDFLQIKDEARVNFKAFAPKFSSRIMVISRPFAEAIEKAGPKIISDEIFKLDGADSGTLILPNGAVVCFWFDKFDQSNHGNHIFFVFKNEFLLVYSRQKVTIDVNPFICFVSVIEQAEKREMLVQNGISTRYAQISEIDSTWSTLVMSVLNFIKYANVETKFVAAQSKSKDILCKYVNDTKLPITFYDSTWMTNIVRSEGFGVRGHFRFQPKKKDGEWTKELIWINDFEKHGYTRKAGILNQTT